MFDTQTLMLWSVAIATITAFIHIAFSVAIFNDAINVKSSDSKSLQFVSPFFWMLAVLLGGVLIAALYWLIHHSTLAKE